MSSKVFNAERIVAMRNFTTVQSDLTKLMMKEVIQASKKIQKNLVNNLIDRLDLKEIFMRIVKISPTFIKTYGTIHLVTLILFKRKQIRRQPLKTLKKAMIGFLRSMLFICGYAYFARMAICSLASNRDNSVSKSSEF